MRSKPSARALLPVLALLALVAVLSSPALASDLLSGEVACNRAQLVALLGRTQVETPEGPALPRPTTLFLTYSSRYGFYQGLALDGPWRNRADGSSVSMPEHHLAFGLNPTLRDVLLNPERPLLDQIGLAREESNSTRVAAGSSHVLTVTIDPTLASSMGARPARAALLVINNLDDGAAARRSSDSKPGRGLAVDHVTDLCHSRFSERDLEVFSILQRVLRVRAHGQDFDYDTEIALYRGATDDTYLAEAFAVDPAGEEAGSVGLAIEIGLDGSGRLGQSMVRGLRTCLPGTPPPCSALSIPFDVFLGPPTFPGAEGFDPDGPETVHLSFAPGHPPAPDDVAAPVDFGGLLSGTTWNRPDRFAAQCGHGNPDDLAATPRSAPLKELLAIELSGEIVAPEALYRRVASDTEAMAGLAADAHTEGAVPKVDPSAVALTVGAQTAQAMLDGSYHDWDCLASWYQAQSVREGDPAAGGARRIIVSFDGIYDTAQVAQDYRGLPGVAAADPVPVATGNPGDRPPRLCATEDGDTIRYVASGPPVLEPDGKKRPEQFYFFVSTGAGEVTLEDTYNAGSSPFIQPSWMTHYGDC